MNSHLCGKRKNAFRIPLICQVRVRYRELCKYSLLAALPSYCIEEVKKLPVPLNGTLLFIKEFFEVEIRRYRRFPRIPWKPFRGTHFTNHCPI